MSLFQLDSKSKLALLAMQGYDIAWRYENIQSGDVRYSLMEPERNEDALFSITEVCIDDVPAWAIDQLEA